MGWHKVMKNTPEWSLTVQAHAHYYAPPSRPVTPPPSSSAPPSSTFNSPEKVDFTSRYETLPIESVDEWEEFLTLKRESFKTCDPIRCWGG